MSAFATFSIVPRSRASSSARGSASREHIADNARVFGFALDAEDRARIEAVLAKSRDLMKLIGDCGDEYR